MMTSWSHPIVFLLISIWAIGRGSIAVAAEVERGTMDLILSRPVPRWVYLTSHVLGRDGGLDNPALRSWRVPRSPFGTTSCVSLRLSGP